MAEVNTPDVIRDAEKIREKRSRELALDLAPDAIKTLERIMKGKMLPGKQRAKPNEMRQAATDILNQAHGRPEMRDPMVGGEVAGGISIVINNFGIAAPQAIEAARPVIDTIAMAQGELEETHAGSD